MTNGILFDNILITHDKAVADDFAEKTWAVKYAEEKKKFDEENASRGEKKVWNGKGGWVDRESGTPKFFAFPLRFAVNKCGFNSQISSSISVYYLKFLFLIFVGGLCRNCHALFQHRL
jgi:hypothetical protein